MTDDRQMRNDAPYNRRMLIESDGIWLHERLSDSEIYVSRVGQVLFDAQTAFQRVLIVDTPSFGRRLYMDGAVQSTEADEFVYHESLVHPAMLAHGAPRRVLILGGGEGATLREVLRWRTVEHVTMVDIDGEAVEACKTHLPAHHAGAFDDPRARVLIDDAFAFVKTDKTRWDVIISDITDPAESGPGRQCFSRAFFSALRRRLTLSGVCVAQAGPCAPAMFETYAGVLRTIGGVFAHAAPYQASVPSFVQAWGFAIASDAPLMPRLRPRRTVALLTRHVSSALRYLDAPLTEALMRPPVYLQRAIAARGRRHLQQ
jgi:spermidine synthase